MMKFPDEEVSDRAPAPCELSMPRRGLYAITGPGIDPRASLEGRVAAALRGGARLVQYRDKSCDFARRRAEAGNLLAVCHARDVPLIVNDDVELAREIGADGVHLGKEDPSLDVARAALGPAAIIGVSCYGDPVRAFDAEANGADYVALGSFFASETKPAAARASPDLIARVRARIRVPIVAIGGITPANGTGLLARGADLLAVISGVFARTDVEAAARAYAALFAEPSPHEHAR